MSKALKAAIEANDAEAVTKAMKTVKDLSKKLPKAEMPTAFAAEIGAEAAMGALLKGGAPIGRNEAARHIGHPVTIAAEKEHLGILKMLLAHEPVDDEVMDHALFWAVRKGKFEIAEALLEHCKSPIRQRTIEESTQWTEGKMLALLLKHGAEVDARNDGKANHEMLGMTSLHATAREGHVQSVRMLLDAGADVNAQDALGRTALMRLAERIDRIAADRERLEKMSAMTKKPIGGRGDCDPPDGLATMRLLLERGADARKMDRFGNDALAYEQWECMREKTQPREEYVALLRKAGAVGGETTFNLFEALKTNNLEGMRAAIKAGADVNRCSPEGRVTPLTWCKSLEAVNILLEAGADPNKATMNYLPLISAARGGELAMVKRLIEAGADIHAIEPSPPNSEYIANAYEAARMNDKRETAEYLKSLGAGKPRRQDWTPLAAGVHTWEDFSEVLVKGDVKSVAEGLAKMIGGKAQLGAYGKEYKCGKRAYVVIRPKGMKWCNVWQVMPQPKRFEDQAAIHKRCKELAAACATPVIEVDYSDTSDAAQIVRVDAQGKVETDEGWDRDSLQEMIDALGKEVPAWALQRIKKMGDDDPSSSERVKMLAEEEQFVAAAFGFYCEGGKVEVDVSGYPAEAFDDAAIVSA